MQYNKPIFWHQGLFLQPQHFQLAELHNLHRLRAVREFGQPFFWGLTRFEVREGALEKKNFEITDIELLFEDGNFVSFPGNAVVESRSFDKAWENGEEPFMVYLGLKKWDRSGANVSVVEDVSKSGNTMFCVSPDPEELPDLLGGGPVGQVKLMNYSLRIFWENELDDLGAYSVIPIARLKLDLEKVKIDQSFIPPALTIRATPTLINIFKDISDQVASRSRRLEQYKNPAGLGTGELDFTSTVFLLALRTLNRYAPLLKHMAEAPNIHPWQVYGLLRQIIGELSSFSRDVSALGEGRGGEKLLPDYDHLNLGNCFEAARDIITHILDGLTAGPEFMTQFIFDDPFFTAEIPDRAFGEGNTFWLIVRTANPEKDLSELQKLAKLSATTGMSSLLARAVHGIGISVVDNPPPGLPKTKGSLCFKIDTESSLWNDVERNRSLSLYWDSAPKEMAAYVAVMRG